MVVSIRSVLCFECAALGSNLYSWFCLCFTKVSFWHQAFFPWIRRNIYTTTLWIPDWNISILWKLVNRNFQKERVKRRLVVTTTNVCIFIGRKIDYYSSKEWIMCRWLYIVSSTGWFIVLCHIPQCNDVPPIQQMRMVPVPVDPRNIVI